MSTKGKGVYAVNSDWSSGNLVFYEKAVGRTATGDVLTIGTTAVTVGGTAQAVDFAWYASGSLSFVLSASDSSMTLVGLNVEIDGDIVIGTDDLAVAQGYYLYLDGLSGGEYVRSASADTLIVNATTSLYLGIGGTAEIVLTATAFSPFASGGNALGTVSLMWSDLFLKSAGVINFNNGNVTITHAAGALACTGALTLSIATASTTTGTGALIVTGGVGIGGAVNIGSSVTITGAVLPAASGTPALGSATLMWSDLFLKSGAVVNFNNGNVTLTHAAGKLTVALPAPTSSIDGFTVNMTSGAVNPGSIRGIVSTLTTFGTAQTGGTLAAIRGHVTTAESVANTYMYGVQGKLTLGTSDALTGSSYHYCGVMAQMDISAGTLTSGHTACLVCSVQDTSNSARALEGIYIELPTYGSGASMNSFVQGNGSATYGLDFVSANIDFLASVPLAATGKSPYSANTTHTSASTAKVGAIAIKVGTDTRYVYVFSDAGS